MIRHVVVFTWDDHMTDEMETQLATELTALAPKLPGLRSYHCGPDVGLVEGNFDFTVVADFDDANAYLAYRSNPDHQAIISKLSGPHTKSRASVQYEI